mmetsp:Transcript_24369/g.96650  ORF Transcript_24369/g.96650 Transcript_24369/m.96650 type:complete len:229 (-) Transcript_24369:1174-1860(-)
MTETRHAASRTEFMASASLVRATAAATAAVEISAPDSSLESALTCFLIASVDEVVPYDLIGFHEDDDDAAAPPEDPARLALLSKRTEACVYGSFLYAAAALEADAYRATDQSPWSSETIIAVASSTGLPSTVKWCGCSAGCSADDDDDLGVVVVSATAAVVSASSADAFSLASSDLSAARCAFFARERTRAAPEATSSRLVALCAVSEMASDAPRTPPRYRDATVAYT